MSSKVRTETLTQRDQSLQHLREVLEHLKNARKRLPPSIELRSWLLTPSPPGGKTPIEYLREGRFNVFRGLVLRATSAAIALSPPVASSIPSRLMSRLERVILRERISPTPRREDDEDTC